MSKLYSWMPEPIAYEQATEKQLQFVLEQAKERVLVQTEDADKLYQRSLILISFSITSLITMVSYLGVNFKIDRVSILLIILSVIMLIISTILKVNIVTERYLAVGAEPNALLIDDFYKDLPPEKTTEWYFLMDLVRAYNDRIKNNAEKNNGRARRIKEAIGWLYAVPFVASAVIFICAICGLS